MQDTLFVVYRLNAFFIVATALLILTVVAHAIEFVQIGKLKKRVSELRKAEGDTTKEPPR